MREPATSCTTCRAALLPFEVLYTQQADVVCADCFRQASPPPGGAQARRSWQGRAAAVLTPQERRGSILRWSLLFAILAASTLQVRHFALVRLHMICPRVSIDAPAAGAAVTRHLVVRGHVAGNTLTRPLWVVARAVTERDGCADVRLTPIVTDPFGRFAAALDLPGTRGQRYAVSVVSVDQMVDGWLQLLPQEWSRVKARRGSAEQPGAVGRDCRWKVVDALSLPPGAAVLASIGLVLGDDEPPPLVLPE